MSEKTEVFTMAMTCDGCANAAKKVLGKLGEGVKVETNVADKTVRVTSTFDKDTLLAQLQKTGKEITYVGPA